MNSWKREVIARVAVEYCCQMDQDLTWVDSAAAVAGLLGHTADDLDMRHHLCMVSLIDSEYRQDVMRQLNEQLAVGEEIELILPLRHREGHLVWVMNRGCRTVSPDGQECLVGVLVDITRSKNQYDTEKQMTRILQERAEKDSLTQIYNARTARKLAEKYLEESDAGCALLIIDLDDFKKVNDQYGHMFGDAVLIQAAQTIQKLFRAKDIVGRIGGEEFMVLMKDVTDREIVDTRCAQLNEAFHHILRDQMGEDPLSCSIGVAMAAKTDRSYFKLFCCADQALYLAKNLGKDRYEFYDVDRLQAHAGKYAHRFGDYDASVYAGLIAE